MSGIYYTCVKNSLVVILIVLSCLGIEVQGTFHFPDTNILKISSEGWDYPHHEGDVDIIWRYTHSIQLEVNELQLDGQSGDFLLISDLPLTFEESFVEWNNSEEVPPFLADSIVTSHGLLLSWELEPGAKFHVLSKYGTFVYFHAEGNVDSRGTFPYKGFNITIQDLDEMRIPPPTTTTEGTKAPPAPDIEIYTSKYLKNPPFQFREERNEFKKALAIVGTKYCLEQDGCKELLMSNFSDEDVNIPTDGGLRMCDMTWDTFETCVQVTFAITREENIGGYLMPKWRLDDMWAKHGHLLEDYGFIPYDNHPKPYVQLDTWIWVASFLGIILFLMVPVCVFWILHEVEMNDHIPSAIDTEEMDKKDNEGLAINPWRDLSNPIRPILAKLRRQSEDTKYLEVNNFSDSSHTTTSNNNTSGDIPVVKKTKTTSNVLFQEQDVTFEYDNGGYHEDDAGDEDIIALYTGRSGGAQRDFMEIADEEFPVEDRFLRMDRVQYDDNSDTEI